MAMAGQALRCDGIALSDLPGASEAAPMGALHGPHLARYVLAQARDGRRVLFSLAELDPSAGGRTIDVIASCDANIRADMPLLLVNGRLDDARTLTGLHTLTVVVAP